MLKVESNLNGMRSKQCGWSGKTARATGRDSRVRSNSSEVVCVWLVVAVTLLGTFGALVEGLRAEELLCP